LLEAEPGLGERFLIELSLPGMDRVVARTVWTNGTFYGAEFVTPITPDRLRSILSHSKVIWPEFMAPCPTHRENPMAGRSGGLAISSGAGTENVETFGRQGWSPRSVALFAIRPLAAVTIAFWGAMGTLSCLALAWRVAGF
jgi:hypothetical protein